MTENFPVIFRNEIIMSCPQWREKGTTHSDIFGAVIKFLVVLDFS